MSASDAIADFVSAMEAEGVRPTEPIFDRLGSGELIRFHCDGDKPGRRNGWAILHTDGRPAGAFGSYKLGIRATWSSGNSSILSEGEALEHRRRCEAERRKRDVARATQQAATAARAERLWRAARSAATHPYLVRKNMAPEELREDGGLLLVPMRDTAGKLWNLQRIHPDGEKRFLTGGRTLGLFWFCGTPGRRIAIGEGVASMAAVRRACDLPVVAAFSAANLDPVARAIHGRYPGAELIICADDDAHLVDHPAIRCNLGVEAARAAARSVGGRVAMPPRG